MIKWISSFISGLKKNQASKYYYRSGWDLYSRENTLESNPFVMEISTASLDNSSSSKSEKKDERIEKKPVEVFKEIIAETPVMNVNNLDEQIKLVTRRKKMLEELGTNSDDEIQALAFLQARKKGLKVKTNFHWASTNLTMIAELVKKYKVAMTDFAAYSKNIPMEAIDELEKYLKEYSKVSNDKPVLKLIIDSTPQSKEIKKDPILLASSPFGRYFYILGAWDKEVAIVDDLIYHGK
jgi:hypothetical protein